MARSRFLEMSAAVAAAVVLVGTAGCGDDDGGDGDDVAAYCDFSAELDEQEGLPSDDQLDRIVELAPGEIRDEIEFVAERVKEQGEEIFAEEDEDVLAAFEEIEAFEAENCGP